MSETERRKKRFKRIKITRQLKELQIDMELERLRAENQQLKRWNDELITKLAIWRKCYRLASSKVTDLRLAQSEAYEYLEAIVKYGPNAIDCELERGEVKDTLEQMEKAGSFETEGEDLLREYLQALEDLE